MAAKYYAVQRGRRTGVFFTWAECQKQVTGFPGAVFKSFPTLEEAEHFAKGVSVVSGQTVEKLVARTMQQNPVTAILDKDPGALIAYVDGSYNNGSGELLDGTEEQTFYRKFADTDLAAMRNVAGEIKGAEAAMRYAVEHGFSKLYIFHDYEGIAKWCQGVWKTNKEGTKAYKAYFDSIQDKLQVVFVKVAAHTGDKYNEMADGLAKQALEII